jgi:hypothetical protein
MTAAITNAATNGVVATLALALVGLWVITQLRIWRYLPRRRYSPAAGCVRRWQVPVDGKRVTNIVRPACTR